MVEIIVVCIFVIIFIALVYCLVNKIKKYVITKDFDQKTQWSNIAVICLMAVCILASFIGITIILCSLPQSNLWKSLHFIKNLGTAEWIGFWTSFIDIAVSIVMTCLIFNYDKSVQSAQYQREQSEDKSRREIAVTQWATAMNFDSCDIKKIKYRHPLELMLLNNIRKSKYDGVVRIVFTSRTPLPINLKIEMNNLIISTFRCFNDEDIENGKNSASFKHCIEFDDDVFNKDLNDIDCMFQFYTCHNNSKNILETRYEFYLLYDSKIEKIMRTIDSLLYYSNDIEHINRIRFEFVGRLLDTSEYYLKKDDFVDFKLELNGRILFKTNPEIDITQIKYSSKCNTEINN